MFSLKPPDANDPQGLMRRKEPNKQNKRKNKLAYSVLCLNNSFFQKQYETRYISTLANSMDPDQLSSEVAS